jgi:hypothetical protein
MYNMPLFGIKTAMKAVFHLNANRLQRSCREFEFDEQVQHAMKSSSIRISLEICPKIHFFEAWFTDLAKKFLGCAFRAALSALSILTSSHRALFSSIALLI